MSDLKRDWNLLSRDQKRFRVQELITFFKKERDEDLGIIAAEDILSFFLKTAGADMYDRGIEDSKKLLSVRFEDLEFDLSALQHK